MQRKLSHIKRQNIFWESNERRRTKCGIWNKRRKSSLGLRIAFRVRRWCLWKLSGGIRLYLLLTQLISTNVINAWLCMSAWVHWRHFYFLCVFQFCLKLELVANKKSIKTLFFSSTFDLWLSLQMCRSEESKRTLFPVRMNAPHFTTSPARLHINMRSQNDLTLDEAYAKTS